MLSNTEEEEGNKLPTTNNLEEMFDRNSNINRIIAILSNNRLMKSLDNEDEDRCQKTILQSTMILKQRVGKMQTKLLAIAMIVG